jgi:hypothetical protein
LALRREYCVPADLLVRNAMGWYSTVTVPDSAQLVSCSAAEGAQVVEIDADVGHVRVGLRRLRLSAGGQRVGRYDLHVLTEHDAVAGHVGGPRGCRADRRCDDDGHSRDDGENDDDQSTLQEDAVAAVFLALGFALDLGLLARRFASLVLGGTVPGTTDAHGSSLYRVREVVTAHGKSQTSSRLPLSSGNRPNGG